MTLFFGGWQLPWVPGDLIQPIAPIVFMLKTYFGIFLLMVDSRNAASRSRRPDAVARLEGAPADVAGVGDDHRACCIKVGQTLGRSAMSRIYGSGILKSMRISFRNFFRKPITVQYPHEKLELPERARWAVTQKYDEDGEPKCTACIACERACPDYIIKIEVTTAEDRQQAHRSLALRDRRVHDVRAVRRGVPVRRDRDEPRVRARADRPGLAFGRPAHRRCRGTTQATPRGVLELCSGRARGLAARLRRRDEPDERGRRCLSTVSGLAFWLFAALCVGGALGMLSSKNVVHAAFWLLEVSVAAAGLFFLLERRLRRARAAARVRRSPSPCSCSSRS